MSESSSDEREFMRCPACSRAFPEGATTCAVDGTRLLPSRGRTLLGRVLANLYRIQQLLGTGGMGEVYLARHLLLEKPLALKVVLPSVADRSTAVALLRYNK